VLARNRLAHPTAPERETIALLDELGQREGTDYFREYRVAPGVYADVAFPERKLAIEVHGSAHDAAFFLARGMAEREARRTAVYEEAGWTVRVVTERDLSADRERTRERLREAITQPEQGALW
jgi:very-short-patch-repair endonuclease